MSTPSPADEDSIQADIAVLSDLWDQLPEAEEAGQT